MADAFNPSAIINESARAAAVASSSGGGTKTETQKVEEQRLSELYKVNPSSSEFINPANVAKALGVSSYSVAGGMTPGKQQELVKAGIGRIISGQTPNKTGLSTEQLKKIYSDVSKNQGKNEMTRAQQEKNIAATAQRYQMIQRREKEAREQAKLDAQAASRFQKQYGKLKEEVAAAEMSVFSMGLGFQGTALPKELMTKLEESEPFRNLRMSQIMRAQEAGTFEAKGISSPRYTKQLEKAEASDGNVSFLDTSFTLQKMKNQEKETEQWFNPKIGMSKAPTEEGVIFGGVSLRTGREKVFIAPEARMSMKESKYGVSEYYKPTSWKAVFIEQLRKLVYAGEGQERAFYPQEIKISAKPTKEEALSKVMESYKYGRKSIGFPSSIDVELPGVSKKVETSKFFDEITFIGQRYDEMRKAGKSIFFGDYPELGKEKNYTGIFKSLGSRKATLQDQLVYGGLAFTIDETTVSLVQMAAGFRQAASFGGVYLAGTRTPYVKGKFIQGLQTTFGLPIAMAVLGKGQKSIQAYAATKTAKFAGVPIISKAFAPVAKALPFEVTAPSIAKIATSAPVIFGGVGFISSLERTGRPIEAIGAGLGTAGLVSGWKGMGAFIEAYNKRLPASMAYDTRGTLGFFKNLEQNFVQSKMLTAKETARFMETANPSEIRGAFSEGGRYSAYQTSRLQRTIPIFGQRKPIYFGKARNNIWLLAKSVKVAGFELSIPRARQIIGTKPNPEYAKYGFSMEDLHQEILKFRGIDEAPPRLISKPLEGFKFPKEGALVRNPKFAEFTKAHVGLEALKGNYKPTLSQLFLKIAGTKVAKTKMQYKIAFKPLSKAVNYQVSRKMLQFEITTNPRLYKVYRSWQRGGVESKLSEAERMANKRTERHLETLAEKRRIEAKQAMANAQRQAAMVAERKGFGLVARITQRQVEKQETMLGVSTSTLRRMAQAAKMASKQASKSSTRQAIMQVAKQAQRKASKQTTRQAVKQSVYIAQRPTVRQATKIATRQASRITTKPPLTLPKFVLPFEKRGKPLSLKKPKEQEFRYTPSLTAIIYNIGGKVPKKILKSETRITGLEFRPIPIIGKIGKRRR